MDPINFYNTGSPKKYKAISRWFFLSIIVCVTTAVSLTYLQFQQWRYQSKLLVEKNVIHTQLHKLDHVAQYQQNQKLLQTKLEKKAEYLKNRQHKNPIDLLKTVKASLEHGASLEAFSWHDKNIELKISGEKTKTLTQCAHLLSQKSEYADIHITALQMKENNRFLGTLKNN